MGDMKRISSTITKLKNYSLSIIHHSSLITKILSFFLVWRVALFAVAFIAILFIPKWGGWFPDEERVLIPTKLPSWIWGFGNFDGVHYLKIMQDGYKNIFSQAFFSALSAFRTLLNLN